MKIQQIEQKLQTCKVLKQDSMENVFKAVVTPLLREAKIPFWIKTSYTLIGGITNSLS